MVYVHISQIEINTYYYEHVHIVHHIIQFKCYLVYYKTVDQNHDLTHISRSIYIKKTTCFNLINIFCKPVSWNNRANILNNLPFSMTMKTRIIKAVFIPTLSYQSKNGILTSNERDDVYQKIYRNEYNLIRMQVNMQPVEQTANKNKIRWWSLAPTDPQSKTLVIRPVGRRNGSTKVEAAKSLERWHAEMVGLLQWDADPDDGSQQLGEVQMSECLSARRRWQNSSTKISK